MWSVCEGGVRNNPGIKKHIFYSKEGEISQRHKAIKMLARKTLERLMTMPIGVTCCISMFKNTNLYLFYIIAIFTNYC